MARLFTGIVVPVAVGQQLVLLQPDVVPGIRLVAVDHIHLTLHFLGDTSLTVVRQALQDFSGRSFSVTIDRLGSFPTAGRTTTLWAGLRESRELIELHQALEARLVVAGYRPEKRHYHPHITLARCDEDVPRKVIESFMRQAIMPMEFVVQQVVLFSSQLSERGPSYQQEAVFAMQ